MTNPSPREVIVEALLPTSAETVEHAVIAKSCADAILEALRSRGYALGRDETIKRARELMALHDDAPAAQPSRHPA
jgi:hypothetical protein